MIRDAVILAGGFGTRLRPLTSGTPKPLLPVAGRPFVETLLARLAQAGVKRVVLSVHHQPEAWRRALPRLRRFSMRLELRREPEPLGTGGAIRFAWPDPDRPCLALNGDALSDFDVRSLLSRHAALGAAATLWAVSVPDTSAFGVLEAGRDGLIRRFLEKPRPGQTRSRLINAGLYALEPEVLRRIPAGRPVSVEREVFPGLLEAGLKVGLCSQGSPYWNDIGTPAAYLRANQDVLAGALWRGKGLAPALWGRPDRGRNILGRGVRMGRGAEVSSSVLGAGCRVDEGAGVVGSVLMDGVHVGSGARVEGAVLGTGCVVGEGCVLRPGAVLGAGTRLAPGSRT